MKRITIPGLRAALLLGLAACASGQQHTPVPLYDNLGHHHYPISTSVPQAQQYFDQGLRLYYAFNHAEAIRAFNEAARRDPACAICHWGTALSHGPNINMPMDSAGAVAAFEALERARALVHHADDRERALIEALATRYSPDGAAHRAALDSAYALSMRRIVERYPDDPEAATLYAEALMNLSPWNYWERDGSARPHTRELLAQLERVLASHPDHPGANHFYIHAVEAVDPARAVPVAERLAELMPGAGHLVHMPGHIYVRVGRYADAIAANEHAIHADESYISDQRPELGIYTLGYYPHNYDFLAFAASMIGREAQSIDAADRMAALIPDEMLGEPGLTLLQNLKMRPLQMRVRFGRWDDILNAPAPAQEHRHARGIWHYARGRALLARGDVAGADAELQQLRAAATDSTLAGARLEFNAAADILGIGAEVLAGRIAAARGEYPSALEHLRTAVRMEDALTYGEPPEWSVPVRSDLGEVQIAAGRYRDAEQSFREDLRKFPDNGWSLNGLAEALRSQNRTAEARSTRERLQGIWEGGEFTPATLRHRPGPRGTGGT